MCWTTFPSAQRPCWDEVPRLGPAPPLDRCQLAQICQAAWLAASTCSGMHVMRKGSPDREVCFVEAHMLPACFPLHSVRVEACVSGPVVVFRCFVASVVLYLCFPLLLPSDCVCVVYRSMSRVTAHAYGHTRAGAPTQIPSAFWFQDLNVYVSRGRQTTLGKLCGLISWLIKSSNL